MSGSSVQAAPLNTPRLTIVVLLFAFSMISYFDRTIMPIAGPELMRDFHLSATQMGGVYSAFVLGYALLMIPGGQVADRLGPRRTLGLMGVLSAAFTALVASVGMPGLGPYLGIVPALSVIRLGLGVSTAPLYPACALTTANWIPRVYHARVQACIIAGSSVGAAVSPLLFTWMLQRFRWRISFVLAAVITAALGILWLWYARDNPPGVERSPRHRATSRRSSWLQLFADRNLMLLTLAYATLGYFQYIFFYWIYYYFGEVLHLGSQAGARYTTILFLTEGAIMPLGGWVSDRLTRRYGPQIGRRVVPMIGLTLAAGFTYAGTVAVAVAPVVVCLSLAFGMAACCEGPFWAAVTELGGERVGGASSILNAGAQAGGFFAPLLTPYIASRLGWSWGLHAGSLAAMLGVLAVYLTGLSQDPPAKVSG